MSRKVLPKDPAGCPFCGKKPKLVMFNKWSEWTDKQISAFYFHCEDLTCPGNKNTFFRNEMQALQAYDKRVPISDANLGKANAWDQIWEWFLKFKPIQETSKNVSVAMDGQIGAVNLIKASFEEYFSKHVD